MRISTHLPLICALLVFTLLGLSAAGVFSADPEEVARAVVRGLDRGKRVIYAPPIWRWVMLALRMIPRRIFRRLTI